MARVTTKQGAVDSLLAEVGVRRLVEAGARQVARNASQIVPRRTGRASRSYKATKAQPTATGIKATAYTDDPAGHIFEWGSATQEASAPLRRGAERAGLRGRLNPKGDDS